MLLASCVFAAACTQGSKHVVDRFDTQGATVEQNSLLGLDPRHVNEILRQKLLAEGHFVLPNRESKTNPALGLQLELAYTREMRKDGREGTFAEVGAVIAVRRREADGFASYEVVGLGEVRIAGDSSAQRREAMQQALAKALEQATSSVHLQLDALDKSDKALIRDLSARDPRVREFALRTLSARKNPAVEPALVEKLKGTDPDSVRQAIGGLVELRSPTAVPPLIELARGKDSGFLREIIFALGAIGGGEAEAYLYTVAQGHDQPAVRAAAQQALDELRGKDNPSRDPRSESGVPEAPRGSPR